MKRNHLKKIALFSVITIIAALPFVFFQTGCKGEHRAHEEGKEETLYQCSMHPQIVSDEPGVCPICNMKLTKVDQPTGGGEKRPAGKGKILYYQHPMNPSVTSPVPAKDEMGMDYTPVYEGDLAGGGAIEIPGHGEVFINAERQQLIGVQKAVVEKKPLTLTIRTVGTVAYDPELYNTYTEYKQAVEAYEKVKDSTMPEVRERAEALIRSAKMKLKLVGLSEEQMQQFLKADTDQTNLLLPMETVWVYADIYAYESGLVKPEQKAKITTPAFPKLRYEGTIRTVDPVLNAMTRSLRVRIEVPDTEKLLKPEMFVDVFIEVPLGTTLAVPEQAVVDTGDTQIVFVDTGEGRMEPREVEVGYIADGFYEIFSGLSEGETVISSANFLIDSESRFRAAAQAFKSGQKKKPMKQNQTEEMKKDAPATPPAHQH